jgi:predicted nucleotidyltransferase
VDPELHGGTLLRQARKRAGLSQVDLAGRAGVTQSGMRPAARPPAPAVRSGGPPVRRHRKDLVAAAAAHGVSNLRVFGSVARGEDRLDSDVDLLADFPPRLSLFGLGRLEADLEGILGTRVDLIPAADLKPGIRERVESDLIVL